jgi:hypothetical protein
MVEMTSRDQAGKILRAQVRWEQLADGRAAWGVNVWPRGTQEPPSEVRRYYYKKRDEARRGNIEDVVGERGRIALGNGGAATAGAAEEDLFRIHRWSSRVPAEGAAEIAADAFPSQNVNFVGHGLGSCPRN